MPCTAAITGCGRLTICCIMALHVVMIRGEVGAAAIGIGAPPGQFLQIVAGAESRPVGGNHDRADCAVGGDLCERCGEFAKQGFRQAVARQRAIEREDDDLAVVLARQNESAAARSAGLMAVFETIDAILNPKGEPCKAREWLGNGQRHGYEEAPGCPANRGTNARVSQTANDDGQGDRGAFWRRSFRRRSIPAAGFPSNVLATGMSGCATPITSSTSGRAARFPARP